MTDNRLRKMKRVKGWESRSIKGDASQEVSDTTTFSKKRKRNTLFSKILVCFSLATS